MDRGVGHYERQAVGQLEAATAVQGPFGTNSRRADCRFMDQLQGQAGFRTLRRLPGPATQQIPSAQAEMFGDQQPHTRQIATNLVGQHLPYTAFNVLRMAGQLSGPLATNLDLDRCR
jgi:hypothetical protein